MRNLGKNARRKASRPAESAQALDAVTTLPANEPEPTEAAVSREEESLVWQALERMPESYREPLILFYREDQSVAEVAGALKLSEDAVKQRLSRGSGNVAQANGRSGRERFAAEPAGPHVHGGRHGRPGSPIGGEQERRRGGLRRRGRMEGRGRGRGCRGDARVRPGVAIRPLRRMVRHVGERPGGADLRARDATLDAGRRMLLFSVAFTIGIFALAFALGGRPVYLVAWASLCAAYIASIGAECIRLVRRLKRISADASPDDAPNETALAPAGPRSASRSVTEPIAAERSSWGFRLSTSI